ncbi:chaperone required for assembly of F1-ATPase [Sphingomonas vulcanisoli]|uniref:Chaperone required for assembly of F1-ATPase n=1 Tax=Sphingomonas vulcanisoli TaxID=1658060 RepID=A0ABX0TS06_9SPHN|nr:chaperone required for assembly of F1-ATPase [Sphingomonas vulcanisoli]
MKRFYKEASLGADGAILLDGRPVKTPARMPLVLPTPALAEAVRAEWAAQGEEIDPRAMPLTGLANAAIDRVLPDPAAFAIPLARYAEADLLCYRADAPAELVTAEAEAWDPLLDWARARFDVHFEIVSGIRHRAQPEATVARLTEALTAVDSFALAAMNPLITIGGSLVAALAVTESAIEASAAFDALHIDELWQAGHWGEDTLATQAREARRMDFLAAARFLALL